MKQELAPSKNGANDFEIALTGVRVHDSHEKELYKILRGAMLLVGLRAVNVPVQEESQLLINFIYKKFGLLTLSEIQLAFEKAVAGELEIETANCFENFSCEYVGKILSAYKKWASQKFNENQMYVGKPKAVNLLTMPADFSELTEIYYQDYLKGKLNIKIMPVQNYEACVKAGYIECVSAVSSLNFSYKSFLDAAKEGLINLIKTEIADTYSENEKQVLKVAIVKIENGEDEIKVINYAKKLAVEFLYKTVKEKGFKQLFIKHNTNE